MHRTLDRSPKLAPLAAALIFAFPLDVWSAAGKVIFAAGDVRLSADGRRPVVLGRGAEVNAGDLISTGANGFTQLLMEDGGRVTIRANSRLKLDEFKYSAKKGGDDRSVMSLLAGSMRAITGWIGHNNRNSYKIKTPTATIGIRGSDGNVGFDPLIGASVQTLAGGHTLTGVDSRGIEHTLNLDPGEVGLLPPGSAAPVKVEQFPFSTAQPAQTQTQTRPAADSAKNESTADGGDASAEETIAGRDVAPDAGRGRTEPTPGVAPVATVSAPPPLTDNSGALPGIEVPPPVAEPKPDPLPGTRIGLLTSNNMDSGYFFLDELVGENLTESDIQKDTRGNLVKYALGHDMTNFGDVSIRNAVASPADAIQTASGITMGVWRGQSDNSSAVVLGYSQQAIGAVNWAYAEAGYFDKSMPLSGAINYTGWNLGGHAYGNGGGAVTLTGATLRADFASNHVTLGLGLKVGDTQWTANTHADKPMHLYEQGSNGFANGFSGHSRYELEVKNNLGQTVAADGHVRGSFTGANFSGALLEYDFMQQSDVDGDILQGVKGIIGFKPDTAIGGVVPAAPATKEYVVVSDVDGIGNPAVYDQVVSSIDTVNHTGWAYAVSDRYSIGQTFAGTDIQVNAAWGNGIRSGMWRNGAIKTSAEYTIGSNEAYAWGTIAKPSVWYLPALITGTASYSVDQATAPSSNDGSSWALNAAKTSLTVDFTRQRVNAQLSLQQAADTYTLSAVDAGLSSGDGRFSADTHNRDLTVTRNGDDITDSVYLGRLRGELGGKGLSAALMGYNLGLACISEFCPGQTLVNGMVAFKGPVQDENRPYAIVNVAASTSFGNVSGIGFDLPAGIARNAGGGIIGFDIWGDGAGTLRYEAGPAVVKDQGSHAATGLSWGRWEGTASVSSDGGTVTDAADNVHYILSDQTGPVQLPLSGTFDYAKVGNTAPTDLQGNTGVLNAALLRADFTHHLVDVKIEATVAGTTLSGSGSGVGLFGNAFQASSDGGGTGWLNVNCAGSCGTSHDGSVTGHFTGVGGTGAGVTYSLGSDNGVAINGAVGFERVGQ